jgi:hypothetical protein
MGAAGRRQHNLDVLRHDERSEFADKDHEVGIGEHCGPMLAAIGVVLEFPDVDELMVPTSRRK